MTLSTLTLLCGHLPFPEFFPSYKTESLYPLNNNTPSPLFPPPGNNHSFCLYEFDCTKYLIWEESYKTCSFVTGLLHLMSSRFMHVAACVKISFLFKAEWYSILYTHITFCWTLYPSMYTCVPFIFWLFWTMLLLTWMYNDYF